MASPVLFDAASPASRVASPAVQYVVISTHHHHHHFLDGVLSAWPPRPPGFWCHTGRCNGDVLLQLLQPHCGSEMESDQLLCSHLDQKS
eukprot:4486547-Karenia_brevis.AAC.1